MKNQRMKSERNFRTIKGLLFLTMLVILACVCSVLAYAEEPVITLDSAALGLENVNGTWQKVYDGKTELDATKVTVDISGASVSRVLVVGSMNVTDLDADAKGDHYIAVIWEKGTEQHTAYLPLQITPKQLAWSIDDENAQPIATAKPVAYQSSTTAYETDIILPEGLKLEGLVAGESLVPQVGKVSFDANALTGDTKITVPTNLTCTAGANTNADNYVIPFINVQVEVTPQEITINDTWPGHSVSFTYGADTNNNGIFDALEISATAKGEGDSTVTLDVKVQVGENQWMTLQEAWEKGLYGNVLRSDTNGTKYTLSALSPSAYYELVGDSTVRDVVIKPAILSVNMPGATYIEKTNQSDSGQDDPQSYQLLVDSTNIPAECLEKFLENVTYVYQDSEGNVLTVNSVSAPGSYTVTVKLPALYSGAENEFENYKFDASEKSAALVIKRKSLDVFDENGKNQIRFDSANGIPDGMDANVKTPDSISRNAIYGHHTYIAYTLEVSGSQGESFTLYIPVDSSLISADGTDPITVEDLYLYDDETGTMKSANKTYTVTLSENGAFYVVEGFAPTAAVTFIIAPGYEAPFWVTPPAIALIVFLILMLLLVLVLIGLKLRRVERTDDDNETLTINTKGEIPKFPPIVIPDKIEDVDACLDEGLDRMAETMKSDVEAVVEVKEYEVDAADAVSAAIKDLKEEAALVDLYAEDHAAVAEMDEMTLKMAAKRAEELQETVEASADAADVSDAVSAAVAEAMAENFNMSADATDAIALVEEESVAVEEIAPVEEVAEETVVAEEIAPVEEEAAEETVAAEEIAPVEEEAAEETVADEALSADAENDNDRDDDNFNFKGFGTMSLDFIDAVADPEKYNDMLEQERLGKIRIVTRYRRSYLSRLAQSQDPIQDYYNEIKNLLLSYKGVKNRISWGYESFNVGRKQVAKFNIKTRMFYVYLALDPAALAGKKYSFTNMSSKKKYANVPVLVKIKGERKFKYVLEMITMLCEETLQLQKKKGVKRADYKLPFMDTEALVNEGMIKKMVAVTPMSETEPLEPEAPETEDFETEVIETVVLETDIAANAEVADDENQNV